MFLSLLSGVVRKLRHAIITFWNHIPKIFQGAIIIVFRTLTNSISKFKLWRNLRTNPSWNFNKKIFSQKMIKILQFVTFDCPFEFFHYHDFLTKESFWFLRTENKRLWWKDSLEMKQILLRKLWNYCKIKKNFLPWKHVLKSFSFIFFACHKWRYGDSFTFSIWHIFIAKRHPFFRFHFIEFKFIWH